MLYVLRYNPSSETTVTLALSPRSRFTPDSVPSFMMVAPCEMVKMGVMRKSLTSSGIWTTMYGSLRSILTSGYSMMENSSITHSVFFAILTEEQAPANTAESSAAHKENLPIFFFFILNGV